MSYVATTPAQEVPMPAVRLVPVRPSAQQVRYGPYRDLRSMPAAAFTHGTHYVPSGMAGWHGLGAAQPIYVTVPGTSFRVNVEPYIRDALASIEARVEQAAKKAVTPMVGVTAALGGLGALLGLLAMRRGR